MADRRFRLAESAEVDRPPSGGWLGRHCRDSDVAVIGDLDADLLMSVT